MWGVTTDQQTMSSTCGRQVTVTSSTSNWYSKNTAIATANVNHIHGVNVGSTSSGGFVSLAQASNKSPCPKNDYNPSAPVDVGPWQVEPIFTAAQGPANCSAGSHGWSRNVTNQVQRPNGSAYAFIGLAVSDTISIGSRNDLGIASSQTGTFTTTGDGSFPDTYYVCSNACPGNGESDALQNWRVNAISLPHSNAVIYKCASITVDGR
jgi:hypothetical protein